MNFRKAIGLALIPAIIISLSSCGKGIDSPIEFAKAHQISCKDASGGFDGNLWNGDIWFGIAESTLPGFKVVDGRSTEVSYGWEDSVRINKKYNISFDLIDKAGNKVASSKAEISGSTSTPHLEATFVPNKGYEAVGYIAYLDGKEIASEKNAIWIDYPLSHRNINNGKCENNYEIELEELIDILPWCTDPDPKLC
jgi:hypothetical protein